MKSQVFEACLVNGWFKVDLVDDAKGFWQLLASITWTIFS